MYNFIHFDSFFSMIDPIQCQKYIFKMKIYSHPVESFYRYIYIHTTPVGYLFIDTRISCFGEFQIGAIRFVNSREQEPPYEIKLLD